MTTADPLAGQSVPSRRQALRLAKLMGCSGAHEVDGGWLPCESAAAMADLIDNGKKTASVTRSIIDNDCGCGCKGAGDCEPDEAGGEVKQRSPKRRKPKRIYTGRGVALEVDVLGPSSFAGMAGAGIKDTDDDVDVKARNRFARDGDLDGLIQDGTPYQRRSRTLSHRAIGRAKKRTILAARLRDLPEPFVEEQAKG